MKLPGSQQLRNKILAISRGKGRVAESDLYNFLLFEFGMYAGGPAPMTATDRWRFTAAVVSARKCLVREKLLQPVDAKSFRVTPRGEAYLAMGLQKVDADARRTLAAYPPTADEAEPQASDSLEQPEPAMEEDEETAEVNIGKLLDDAELKYLVGKSGGYIIPVHGKRGSWLVDVREANGWLLLSTHVLALSNQPRAKASMLEAALKANTAIAIWKFCLTSDNDIRLEAELNGSQCDGKNLRDIVWMLEGSISEKCAQLARIESDRQPLDLLEEIFKRSS